MNKSIRGEAVGDRLSELPDSLIFDIFHYLPIKDVVRTALLSKRYEKLWKTVPSLNFEGFDKKFNTHSIGKFVAWVVMLRRGNKILKLKIDFSARLNKSLYDYIDLLVHFGKEYGVEELDINLKYFVSITQGDYCSVQGGDEKLYWATQGLYSCSSIKRLYLKGCNLRVPANNVSWNRLEYLSIDGYVVGQDLINKVLCGSTKLEVLILRFMENHEKLSIQSSSLRHLYVYKYLFYDAPSEVTELRISTPKLQRLEHLSFYGNDFVEKTLNQILEKTLKQILPTIHHVEELILSDWCIKALGEVKNRNILSPFPNVEVLRMSVHLEEYEKVAHLLELFPQIEKLVIEKERGRSQKYDGRESVVEVEADFPDSFLKKLRTISITWSKGENWISPFVEILLKHASRLRKMEFRMSNTSRLQSASEKVLRMPRSSPSAELIFCRK